MHDSGERRTFQTGAVRDTATKKPRPDLISPFANLREGEWMRKGAEKYNERNWEKGMPFSVCLASMTRHLLAYASGDRSEDHLAGVRTNASFLMHYEEMICRGVLPASLIDLPDYRTRPVDTYQGRPVHRVPLYDPTGEADRLKASGQRRHDGLTWYAHKAHVGDTEDTIYATDGKHWRSYQKRGNDKHASWGAPFVECGLWDFARPLPGRPSGVASPPAPFGPAVTACKTTTISTPCAYLSGPMRGIPDHNFPAFDAAANAGRKRGFRVVSPADMDRERSHETAGAMTDNERLRVYANRDTAAILELRPENGDVIALLPGWEYSRGATAELLLARWLNIPAIDATTWKPFSAAHSDIPELHRQATSVSALATLIGEYVYGRK